MTVSIRSLCCVIGLAVAMGTAGISGQGRATGAAATDPELQKLADEFVQAWAKGDAKALAAMHTEDAIRIPGDGQVIAGRAAIEKSFTEGLSGMWKGSKLTITAGQFRQVAPNVQVAEGRYQIMGGTPAAGAPTGGQYLNTLVRQDGRWRLASSAIIPPPPAMK